MRGSEFLFSIDLWYYDLHKVSLNRGGSYIDSPKWLKGKKGDKYNWKEISFPSHQKDWKKFESNNKTITLNILYVPHNTEKIRHAYKSKYNL